MYTKHHLIVVHDVINVGNDRSQLARMAKEAKATLGMDNLDVVADRGYFDSEGLTWHRILDAIEATGEARLRMARRCTEPSGFGRREYPALFRCFLKKDGDR